MYKLLSPTFFLKSGRVLIPLSGILFLITLIIGLYFALFNSPQDYQQGETVRIMYIHVPSAWMSLGIYGFIAVCSVSALVWKTRLTYIFAVSAAPIGAGFTLITLITGSIWGKPIWGTWWVWDARLTSMLVLFFIYLSYIAIVNSGNNLTRGEKPASVTAIIGFINIPIVKFSVDIWYSLHQPAGILNLSGPSVHSSMLLPLLIMFGAFILYFIFVFLLRTKIIIHDLKYRP